VTDPLAEALDRLVPAVAVEPDWADVLARAGAKVPLHRNRRVWYVIAVAAVVLGILVSPAFGLGDRILDFFTGSPAPEPVKQELSFGTNVGDPEIDELMHQQVDSKVLVGQAHGLLAVQTPAGLLRIWGAPTSDGGLCTYMRVDGASNGWLSCDSLAPDSGPLVGAAEERSEGGKTVRYVSGQARDEVASIELRLTNGTTLPVRLVGSFFFRALFPGQEPAALVGRDSSGEVVSELPVALGGPSGVLPPTYPIGPSHQVFVLATEIGQITMELAPGPGRKHCWIVTAETSQFTSCRAVRGLEFDLGPYYNPEQTDRIVLLSGLVDKRVRALRLEFEDGGSVAIPIVQHAFVYELPKTHWRTGRRPTRLVAVGSDGDVITHKRVVPDGL
jgi:hypothetical protein